MEVWLTCLRVLWLVIGGRRGQRAAARVSRHASIKPKPCWSLWWNPAPFRYHWASWTSTYGQGKKRGREESYQQNGSWAQQNIQLDLCTIAMSQPQYFYMVVNTIEKYTLSNLFNWKAGRNNQRLCTEVILYMNKDILSFPSSLSVAQIPPSWPSQKLLLPPSIHWLTLTAEYMSMLCTSLHDRQGLTSSISATIPAAIGAAADVPVNPFVQPPLVDVSVVTMVRSFIAWPLE